MAASTLSILLERRNRSFMDFATVRFLRVVFAACGAVMGAAVGFRYLGGFPLLGPIGGGIVGAIVGWNAVDLIKGRAHK
jgi:divalent metal cation (Fe/Co/Zn/Cd) transporter